ncbi:MAG: GGDEF domain-containing protein [Acidimicrobiales bacterium]
MAVIPVRRAASPEVPARVDWSRAIRRAFWVRHIRTGFGVFLAETVMVAVYLAVTPDGPHRGALRIIVAAWAAFALAGLVEAPRLASTRRPERFSAAATILSAVAVGCVAALDGGADSPTLYLLFLPPAFAALAFTPLVATACGGASLVCAALVVMTDTRVQIAHDAAILQISVLAGAAGLAVAAAVNRGQRERHEQLLAEEVALSAATDGLTGCAVHRVFYERLETEVARSVRNGHPLSLLMIDVDEFKKVNDTFGHVVGDKVLAAVGSVLRGEVRSFDLAGRLGGDEFAVLMPDTEPSSAFVLAQRIRREVAKVVEVPMTLSVGVGHLDPSAPTAELMVEYADLALYQAKAAGRDAVAGRPSGPPVPVDHPEAVRIE